MPIALDATSTGASVLPGVGPVTWNHTCSGVNRVLFVAGLGNGVVSGITYNGVALTKLASATDSNYGAQEIWGLLNPATGTHTISATLTGSAYIELGSVSYTGVKQTGLPDAIASKVNQASVTSITTSITTVADNSWILSVTVGQSQPSAGTNQTSRFIPNGSNNSLVGDTNGVQTPAGIKSVQSTFAGSVASASQALVSFAPIAVIEKAGAAFFNMLL